MECKIQTHEDMARWLASPAYKDIVQFILFYNDILKGKKLDAQPFIQTLKKLVSDTSLDPPSSTRFGNTAFKRYVAEAERLIFDSLSENREAAQYILDSLGNALRIDYGTGHELMFLCFLTTIWKQTKKDAGAIPGIPHLLISYIELVRSIQIKFRLEPAGSHGVWGLDDFQFIPFIWGSAQLIGDPEGEGISTEAIIPKNPLAITVIEMLSKDYMFFDAIRHILKVKPPARFSEHSQLLCSIASLKSWQRINEGLLKMYKQEVLGKLQVVRMMRFGEILKWQP